MKGLSAELQLVSICGRDWCLAGPGSAFARGGAPHPTEQMPGRNLL